MHNAVNNSSTLPVSTYIVAIIRTIHYLEILDSV